MLALEIEKTEVKLFMSKLLREELFDTFEIRSVEIATNTRISIDGTPESPEADFPLWGEIRPLVYEIIKLCTKPRHVKIVFSKKDASEIHTNAAALFLNLTYENDSVTFTTASAQKEFILDKSLDTNWDEWIRSFFIKSRLQVFDRE